jgi:hypothetical protein
VKKKKSGSRLSSTSATVPISPNPTDEMVGDRGRRVKSKLPIVTQSRFATENIGTSTNATGYHHTTTVKKDKERSRSRDAHPYSRKHAGSERHVLAKTEEYQVEAQSESLATVADFKRMQKELEALKKVRLYFTT